MCFFINILAKAFCISIESSVSFIGQSIKLYQFELKNQYKTNSDQNKTGEQNGVKNYFCAGRALPIYDEYIALAVYLL